MHTITRKLKEANGSDGDGVELGSATQKLKDSRKVIRKCVIFIFFLVRDYFSVWLQGNLRKINVKRVKNF